MHSAVLKYIKDLIKINQVSINSEGMDLLLSYFSELLQKCSHSWQIIYNKELETNDLIQLNFLKQYKSLIQQDCQTLAAEINAIEEFEMNEYSKAKLGRLKTQAAKILWLTKQITVNQLYDAYIECLKRCEVLGPLEIIKIKCFIDFISTGHEVFTDLQEIYSLSSQYFSEIVKNLEFEQINEEIIKDLQIFRDNLTLLSHLIEG